MSEPTRPTPPLGFLSGLAATQIPSANSTSATVSVFIADILREAIPFAHSITAPPTADSPSLWRRRGTRTFRRAMETTVSLLDRVVRATDIWQPQSATSVLPTPQTWACRRSVHVDAAQPGTASWPEFARYIRDEHVLAEAAYTPSVLRARAMRRWRPEVLAGETVEVLGRRWGKWTAELVEGRHHLGFPLRDRVFGYLLVTATAMAPREDGAGVEEVAEEHDFVIVSVAVEGLETLEEATISRERAIVRGVYSAVERVRRIAPRVGEGEDEDEVMVEWVMTTASDAKGWLPMWLQTRAVPGQIAKDVDLFMAWIADERNKDSR